MNTKNSLPQPTHFLTALWGDKPAAPIHVWTWPGKKSHWLRDPKEADRDWRKVDVYTGVALPPADKDLREDNRVESHEAAAIAGLWCDLDWEDGAHKKPGLPTRVEVETFIAALEPKPTIVVMSGHGYQLWWLFSDRPWVFKDDAERQEAQQLAERWQTELRRRLGKALDSTWDLARVMRLPGTTNYKGTEPVPVALEKDDGPQHAVEEWRERAKGWPVEAKTTQGTTSGKKARPGGPEPQSGGYNFVLQKDAVPDIERLDRLRAAESKVTDALDHKLNLTDQSMSGYDMSLASLAAAHGWSDQEIVDLLIYHRRKHTADLKLNRPDYYERTIRKARAKQPITEEHIESAPLSELAGLGILRILELRDAPNPSRYRIVTKDRTLELPNISHLTQNRKFRDAIGEALKKWPKGLKGDVWDAFVQRLFDEVEVIEPGHPDHPRSLFDKEETQEWLSYYLDAYKIVDEEDANVNGAPFTKNGVTYIFAHHFSEWLVSARSEKLTSRALYSRLKDAGWETHKVRLAQKANSVNAWRPVPASAGTGAHTQAGDHAHARAGTTEHAI